MISPSYLRGLFSHIDRRDAEAFAAVFATDGLFRFGNNPPVRGPESIGPVVAGFFSALSGISHQLDEIWALPDATLCHGRVRYTRGDGDTLEMPFAVIVKGCEGALREYLIFVDNSALADAADDA